MIWTKEPPLEELHERAKKGLAHHLEIEFTEVTKDSLTARMEVTSKHLQPFGTIHGGATAALAETVGSVAGNYCVNSSTQMCLGMELNINHLRPVAKGFIYAVAHLLHRGKTTQVWEIKVSNEEKKLMAAARLTLAVVSKTIK